MAERVQFSGRVRRFKEDAPGGLAVVDVPAELVGPLGGRRQYRVTGMLDGSPYTGSAMLVAGGGFCVSVSKAVLDGAGAALGDEVALAIERAAPDG